MAPQRYRAWRYVNGRCLYVQTTNEPKPGDRYSFCTSLESAAVLTERQCRIFHNYMRRCGTVGYWGMR